MTLKSLKFWISSALFTSTIFVSVAQAQPGYPYCGNPYVATFTAAVMKERWQPGTKKPLLPTRELGFTFFPERSKLPQVGSRNELKIRYYIGHRQAPTVLILTGLGSDGTSGYAKFLLDQMGRRGYNALIIPSVFSWRFMTAASDMARPGNPDIDVPELRRVITYSLGELQRRHGIQTSNLYAVGVSLGAFHGAYLAAQPTAGLRLNKAVLVNPPLNLISSMKQIDVLRDHVRYLTPDQRRHAEGMLTNTYLSCSEQDMLQDGYFENIGGYFGNMSQAEWSYALGWQFRESIQDAAMVSQLIRDDGLLKPGKAYQKYNQTRLMRAEEYLTKIAFPYYRSVDPSLDSMSALQRRSSIWPVLNQLKSNRRVKILHTHDDILMSPQDLRTLSTGYSSIATVYQCGGHVGGLWGTEMYNTLHAFLN